MPDRLCPAIYTTLGLSFMMWDKLFFSDFRLQIYSFLVLTKTAGWNGLNIRSEGKARLLKTAEIEKIWGWRKEDRAAKIGGLSVQSRCKKGQWRRRVERQGQQQRVMEENTSNDVTYKTRASTMQPLLTFLVSTWGLFKNVNGTTKKSTVNVALVPT